MLRRMQYVFPLYTQIEMQTITKYGFTNDGEGKGLTLDMRRLLFYLLLTASVVHYNQILIFTRPDKIYPRNS